MSIYAIIAFARAMVINFACNGHYGPGGGTRRLHLCEFSVVEVEYGGDVDLTCV